MNLPFTVYFQAPGAVYPLAVELRAKMKRDSIVSKLPIGRILLKIVDEMDSLAPKIAEELAKFPDGGMGKQISFGVPTGYEKEMLAARDKIALLGCDLGTTAGKAFVALVAAYYADKA